MTKSELKRCVSEFNRLSDRAVELFEIHVDNPTRLNDVAFWNAMDLLKQMRETLESTDADRLRAAHYIYEYGNRQMYVTRLEVW